MTTVLKIQNVSKTYSNGVKALENLNLEIPSGMYGLLGPNGAGKSTLMRILATLQQPDSGEIYLNDINLVQNKMEIRKTLGYLPQDFGLLPGINAKELLNHFAILKGINSKKERADLVDNLLQQTNLWEKRHQKVTTFSGGMKQRFGVAVALLGNPTLLIVDEPTAGLDPGERVRFLNLLSELGEKSVVILSTHIVEDVAELCTSMAIIEKGEDSDARITNRGCKIFRRKDLEENNFKRTIENHGLTIKRDFHKTPQRKYPDTCVLRR